MAEDAGAVGIIRLDPSPTRVARVNRIHPGISDRVTRVDRLLVTRISIELEQDDWHVTAVGDVDILRWVATGHQQHCPQCDRTSAQASCRGCSQ